MSEERHREYSEFQVLDAPWQASHSGWVATQACRYLSAWGLRQDPQFMHLGFCAPHPPMNPMREMFEPYRDQEMVDVLPTLSDLTRTPRHPVMAGRSYAQSLLDGSKVKCRDDVCAVHGPGHIMLRTEEYTYLRYIEENGHREVLYDLQADPGEFKNMANGLETLPARELKERALARTIEASRSILPRRLHF